MGIITLKEKSAQTFEGNGTEANSWNVDRKDRFKTHRHTLSLAKVYILLRVA